MKPNTALAVLLLCLPIFWQRLTIPAALTALVFSLLVLSQHVTGADLGIDEFFFKDPRGQGLFQFPGRMSAITCVAIAFDSIAILLTKFCRQLTILWQGLYLLTLLMLGLVFLGYAFDATDLARLFPYKTVSINTTFALSLMTLAYLFSLKDRGLLAEISSPHEGGRMARKLLLPSIASLFAIGFLVRFGARLGFFDESFDAVLIVCFGSVIISWIIWTKAAALNQSEEKLESSRSQSNEMANTLKILLDRTQELQLHSLIVEKMAEGVCLIRARDGIIVFTNPKFTAMFGYRQNELEGQPASILHFESPLKSSQNASEEIFDKVRTFGSYTCEIRTKRKDGEAFWCRATTSLFDHIRHGEVFVLVQEDITAQKSWEEQLISSEKKYRDLVEGAYDSILVADRSGKITLANRQLCQKFGYKLSEILGQPVEVLLPERFRADHYKNQNSFMLNPQARPMGVGLDLWARKRDGTEFPVDISISPTQTPEGLKLTAIIRDVTDRKRSEDQQTFLAQTAKILDETLDYRERIQRMAEAVVSKIADECIVRVLENQTLKLKAATTSDSLKAPLLHELAHRGIGTKGPASAEMVLNTGQTIFIEDTKSEIIENPSTDRGLIELVKTIHARSYLVVPLRVRNTTIGTMALIMSGSGRKFSQDDITFIEIVANRCAVAVENARLYRNSRLAEIVANNMPAMIAYWDKDEFCQFANQAYRDWFGYTPEQMVGMSLREVLGPELYESNRGYIQGALQGQPQYFERELKLRESGQLRFTKASYIPDLVADRVVGFFALVVDVTDLKQAQLKAEAAVKTRENVLAIVSHDLKNPLTTVAMAAEILSDLKEGNLTKVKDLSKKIQRSTKQMQNLIRDLLDFSKIQTGSFAIEKSFHRPIDIIEPIIESFQLMAHSKNIKLNVELPKDLPLIYCDATRIGQVLSNLIGNAVKFTPDGGSIWIGLRLRDKQIEISVSDSGPGIPSELLTKVFDRYWQSEEAKKMGTGLGLSIAKGIVEAHKGIIWAESTMGSGSSFFFAIPRVDSATQPPLQPPVNLPLPAGSSPRNLSVEGANILLVEDSQDVLLLAKKILTEAGAQVFPVNNLHDAEDLMQNQEFDIVLTDIDLPDGSGCRLADPIHDKLGQRKFRPHFVAFTACEGEDEIKKINQSGFESIIQKPVSPKTLVESIQKIMQSNSWSH